MSRPLIITDCDEVLLHMVTHFRDWLGEEHAIDFVLEGNDFANSMRRRGSGDAIDMKEIWRLLGLFFDHEMDRQTMIPGAGDAVSALSADADVVVLTNLMDHRREARTEQLASFGIEVPVYTNQGPKGPAIRAIIEEYSPSLTVFIDDIANHHQSASEEVKDLVKLHFCGEPSLAPHIPCGLKAGHADARIDEWATALPWVTDRLAGVRK